MQDVDDEQEPGRSQRKMNSPSDDLNERLRKAREEAQRRIGPSGETDPKPKLEPKPNFVPYGTMFKLEDRVRPAMGHDINPRQLKCVNCGLLLEWRIYTLDPERFDAKCRTCGMTAHEFWKGKLHKGVCDA